MRCSRICASSSIKRQAAAVAVNVSLTMLYWRIGRRIRDEVLRHKRADYCERIVATLSRQLAAEYGRGFEEKNLRRMVQFAEAFADEAIVATLWRQLSWSHFRELLPLKRPLQREFRGLPADERPEARLARVIASHPGLELRR